MFGPRIETFKMLGQFFIGTITVADFERTRELRMLLGINRLDGTEHREGACRGDSA